LYFSRKQNLPAIKRRNFLQQSSLLAASLGFLPAMAAPPAKDLIIGHGDFRYKVDVEWGTLSSSTPVKDCHEMVQDRLGRLILLTNHTRNNVIIYNKDGKLLSSWGDSFPGAHGLTLKDEGGEDFLYLTDTELHQVIKTTPDGRELLRIQDPKLKDAAGNLRPFLPTETAIAENGDIYVADGYGSQYIYVYDQQGNLKHEFGGPGPADDQFHNAHGIAIDERDGTPKLLITARKKNQLKYFDMAGNYLSTIDLPGAFICRPVIRNAEVYLATIWSGDGGSNTGFVSVLDKNNRLVSAPGGLEPTYSGEQLSPVSQAITLFKHPHDVCVDDDENLYVPQWNSGQVYPIKLHRV
jgi:peptidylamidoglycolate lyase